MSNLKDLAEQLRSIVHAELAQQTIHEAAAILERLARADAAMKDRVFEWLTPNKNGTWRGNLGYEPPVNGAGYKNLSPLVRLDDALAALAALAQERKTP